MAEASSSEVHVDGVGAWITLPTYNERDNLEPLISRLLDLLPDIRILIVDDNSPDGTGLLADRLAVTDPRISVFHRTAKQGLGAAYRAAFQLLLARPDCDVIVQMDCDFSHDPADVPRLIAELEAGADLVIGSRYVRGGGTPAFGFGRRLISRGGSRFARTMLDLPVRDLTGGFKAWRTDLLRTIDLAGVETQGYGFQVEMTWRAHRTGAVIREIPIIFGERRAGTSKMSRRIFVEAFLMVMRLRGADRSASPAARLPAFSLMRGTGSVAVDDLGAVAVPGSDGPSAGGLAADRAGEPDHRV